MQQRHDRLVCPATAKGPTNTVIDDQSEAARMHIALSEDNILHSYSHTINTIPSLYSWLMLTL